MKILFLIIAFNFIVYIGATGQCDPLKMVSPADDYISISFPSSDTGYAVSTKGVLIRSTDKGNSWLELSRLNENTNSIFFINTKVGFTAGDSGAILKTIDAGKSWKTLSTTFKGKFNSIYFIDPNRGFVLGDSNTFLQSIDGGKTWKKVLYDYPGFLCLNSIHFFNSSVGYVTGYTTVSNVHGYSLSGVILKTVNSGKTWVTLNTDFSYTRPNSIWFINENLGFVVANYYPPVSNSPKNSNANPAKIMKTSDGGYTWKDTLLYNNNNYHDFRSIVFKDERIGYIAGSNVYLKTFNGGNTWNVYPMPPSNYKYRLLNQATLCGDSACIASYGSIFKENECEETQGAITPVFNNRDVYSVNIYPTVVQNDFFIESTSKNDVRFSVVNTLGLEVVRGNLKTGNTVETINVDVLSSGIYFVAVESGYIKTVYKIIKQ